MITLPSKNNKGFTLVELMIAIAVSSVLMLGVSQIFSSSKRTYKLNTELARTQENVRYAVEEMARDIRMAGYTGCRNNTKTNTLAGGTNWKFNLGKPLLGFEGGVDTFPTEYASDVMPGTDSIIVLRGGSDTGVKIVTANDNAASMKVSTKDHGIEDGDIIMLSDCSHSAIMQVVNASPGTNVNITHGTGSGSPGNCTKGTGSADCSEGVNGTNYNWNKDAHVVKFLATAYYIGASANGLAGSRSLYRSSVDKAVAVAEELIEGVGDMQITYGYDTNGDGLANRYVTANNVTGNDFESVVSVRLGLLFQSRDNAKRSIDTKDYIIAGTTISSTSSTPGAHEYSEDHRLRYAVNSVIKLRNQGIK